MRGEIFLLDHFGGSRIGEDLGVGCLVVVSGVGVGDEDAGKCGEGDFRERGGTGTGDDEIGHRVGGGHLVAEADEFVAGALDWVFLGDAVAVVGAGNMEDLDFLRKQRGGFGDELIEAERALRSAGYQKRGFFRIQPEAFGGLGAGGEVQDLGPGGGAGELGGCLEECGGGLKADEDLGAEARGENIRTAGASVRIVDEGFPAEPVPCVNGWERGEAAHAEDGVGSEFADNAFRCPYGLQKRPEEGDHFKRKRGGLCDGGDKLEGEVRVFRGCLGVDFLLGNEKQRFVTLGEEGFRDGDSGKEVAAGAAAGDEDFHREKWKVESAE